MRTVATLLVGTLLAGCLSVPDGPEPMCQVTADCDSGEVCDEGICYGNPPAGPFAAAVAPPTERTDLVVGEYRELFIAQDGWLGTIQLPEPVTYSGTIRARCDAPLVCDANLSIAATIIVSRPAQIEGGPSFRSVVTVKPGETAFQLVVPRTGETDRNYTVTVVPDGRDVDGSMPTTAQLLPPTRTEIGVSESTNGKIIELGGTGLASISGTLRTAIGAGLPNYRVVALGRWDLTSPVQEVSTVDYTSTDGKFMLVLSPRLVGTVDIVARPRTNDVGPTLQLGNVLATQSSANHVMSQPANLGALRDVVIPVTSIGGSGGAEPVRGARVMVTSSAPSSFTDPTITTFVAEATTDEDGHAKLKLYDGEAVASRYRISVAPPASAPAGAVFDEAYTIGDELRLPRRLAIRGVVTDVHGEPLKDVAVTARPSLRFSWSLPEAPQQFLSAIPAATTVTPETGEFVIFVDGAMAGTWGFYDLVYEPTAKSRAPGWIESVEIPHDNALDTLTLPSTALPDAAFVRGEIVDPHGEVVEGADVKLFRVETSTSLCTMVAHEPEGCPIPARIVGRGTSDDDGTVRLTLPR